MTQRDKIEKWVKGRLFEVMGGIGAQDAKSVLTDLLSFMDLLVRRPMTADQVNLDECICDIDLVASGREDCEKIRKHIRAIRRIFAGLPEWQADFDEETYVKSKREELENMIPGFVDDRKFTDIVLNFFERGVREGIQKGLQIMNQQMMKDAVHGNVDYPLIGHDFPNIYPNYRELKDYCDRHNIKDRDKVKLIIIKDE